jgi:hypothetical protein
VVAVGLIITLTPLGSVFGFVLPPAGFYLFLIATVAAPSAPGRGCQAALLPPCPALLRQRRHKCRRPVIQVWGS